MIVLTSHEEWIRKSASFVSVHCCGIKKKVLRELRIRTTSQQWRKKVAKRNRERSSLTQFNVGSMWHRCPPLALRSHHAQWCSVSYIAQFASITHRGRILLYALADKCGRCYCSFGLVDACFNILLHPEDNISECFGDRSGRMGLLNKWVVAVLLYKSKGRRPLKNLVVPHPAREASERQWMLNAVFKECL
jgi:hypothetical protein